MNRNIDCCMGKRNILRSSHHHISLRPSPTTQWQHMVLSTSGDLSSRLRLADIHTGAQTHARTELPAPERQQQAPFIQASVSACGTGRRVNVSGLTGTKVQTGERGVCFFVEQLRQEQRSISPPLYQTSLCRCAARPCVASTGHLQPSLLLQK